MSLNATGWLQEHWVTFKQLPPASAYLPLEAGVRTAPLVSMRVPRI